MPTALELKQKGWQQYVEAARSRHKHVPTSLREEDEEVLDDLLARVREAARVLRREFGARRIILVGSLAHRAWFTLDSDVDLVVEGIAPDKFWKAWPKVEDIVGDRPVDLIDYEMTSPEFREAIEEYGIAL